MKIDFRQIVIDRMAERDVSVGKLEELSGVNRQTLYPFLRGPSGDEEYGGKVRRGSIGSDALAAVLDALALILVPSDSTAPSPAPEPTAKKPKITSKTATKKTTSKKLKT